MKIEESIRRFSMAEAQMDRIVESQKKLARIVRDIKSTKLLRDIVEAWGTLEAGLDVIPHKLEDRIDAAREYLDKMD